MTSNILINALALTGFTALCGCSLTDQTKDAQTYYETVKVDSSASLTAPAEFDFSNSKKFQVNVEVASLKGRRGYFQVCRDFEETDRGIQMGYRDCLIRGSLEDGSFDSILEVPNHFNELAVEARSYDANENPYRYIWRRAVDGNTITLKL
jgi:hypothetical protein